MKRVLFHIARREVWQPVRQEVGARLKDGEARFGTAREPPGGMMGASAGLPNMRLKLAGADRFKGSGVLCPTGHELSFNDAPRGERVARSLTAFR